jgi:hypothetical protein
MPISNRTLAYVQSLREMRDITLIEQFFKKKGPIARAEVALEIERRASMEGKKPLIWLRDALYAAMPPMQSKPAAALHERHQAPIYKAFDVKK